MKSRKSNVRGPDSAHKHKHENKRTSIVDELEEKHRERLARARLEWNMKMARQRTRPDSYISDVTLFSKWAYRVGQGWYGFSLGHVPRVWTDVLDEFLQWMETQRPDFEIHQVKMKFRRLRFYAGTKTSLLIPDQRIRSEISKLENLLSVPECGQISIHTTRKNRKPSRKQ